MNLVLICGFYDLVFVYLNGDFNKLNVEVGVVVFVMLCIGFCYKGGVMWKM